MRELLKGVFTDGRQLYTVNSVPETRVYGEQLVKFKGQEFRAWNPFRSKLAGALKKGLKYWPFNENSNVLYLGAATGTTLSHISDICPKGISFGVDISGKTTQKLLTVCQKRKNIFPVLESAEFPENYKSYLEGMKVDLLYQDISQKNQAEILLKNAELFLPKNGIAFFIVKAKSISSTLSTEKIVRLEEEKIRECFEVLQKIPLMPFDKHHAFYVLKKRG